MYDDSSIYSEWDRDEKALLGYTSFSSVRAESVRGSANRINPWASATVGVVVASLGTISAATASETSLCLVRSCPIRRPRNSQATRRTLPAATGASFGNASVASPAPREWFAPR